MPRLSERIIARYLPVLVGLFLVVTLAGDKTFLQNKVGSVGNRETGAPIAKESHDRDDSATTHEDDHSDPEKNHRMAIFHYNEGNKAFKAGQWEAAVRNYEMALHHDQEIQEVYINLSTTYLHSKNYEQAFKTLEILNEKNPSHPQMHYNYACYYALTNQMRASLESLRKAVELGFKNLKQIETDPDLENLRRTSEYSAWIKSL